jgi:hypothetical protein
MPRYSSNSIAVRCALGAVIMAGLWAAARPTIRASAADRHPPLPNGVSVIASTVPANGDVNPYGISEVPVTTGNLVEGHFLVSNFNASSNLQGTGTTIVDVAPNGAVTQFAQINPATLPGACPGGVGLTTALNVLQTGWVIVGSLPTSDGTSNTAQAGCLIVLNSSGTPVETFNGSLINGPWDSALQDGATVARLYVTNVLNGTVAGGGNVVNEGTVVRLNLVVSTTAMPVLQSITVIGSGFSEETNSAALVIGPTGVGLSGSTLYVADSLNNRIAAIPSAPTRTSSASTGMTISTGGALNDPLGLAISANGNILTTNGNNGGLVITTPAGSQLRPIVLDNTGSPPGAGTLFGLVAVGQNVYFVDDGSNTLNLFQ